MPEPPLIVGIGGAANYPSSTDRALAYALSRLAARGVQVRHYDGAFLARLPLYVPNAPARTPEEIAFVEGMRRARGVIIASPGYHGSVSGLVKNALDLLEETSRDDRVYLSGLPVGLIATAHGWQATGGTIAALRAITHALRGWPTPLAVAINSAVTRFAGDGGCEDAAVLAQLDLMGAQVLDFIAKESASV